MQRRRFRKHHRILKANMAVAAALIASGTLAGPASASSCGAGTYYYAAQFINPTYSKGLAGMVAEPHTWAINPNKDGAHMLGYVTTAIPFTSDPGCPGSAATGWLCWLQAGGGVGSIGAGTNASSWRPYVEEYADGSAPAAGFRNDLSGSPAKYYAVYNTGTYFDDGATRYYQWNATYNLYPSVQLLGTGYYSHASTPAQQNNFEDERFTNGTCPGETDMEFGTHGYGTYYDDVSKIKFDDFGTWRDLEGTYTGSPYASTNTAPNPPINNRGWFVNNSAWNVTTK